LPGRVHNRHRQGELPGLAHSRRRDNEDLQTHSKQTDVLLIDSKDQLIAIIIFAMITIITIILIMANAKRLQRRNATR
jgi:hypothetical protein